MTLATLARHGDHRAFSMLTIIRWKSLVTDDQGSRVPMRARRVGVGPFFLTLFALCLCAAPSYSVGAQATATAPARSAEVFVLLRGNDTVAVEDVQQSDSDVSSALDTRGRGRYVIDARVDTAKLVSRLELSVYGSGGSEPTAHAIIAIIGDSVFAQVGPRLQHALTTIGAVPWVNPSFSLLQIIVQRAVHVGTASVTVPLFLVEGGTTASAIVTRAGRDSTIVNVGGIELRLHTSPDGEILGGVIPSQRTVIVRTNVPFSAKGVALSKPDYNAPSTAPYTAEDVRVKLPKGYALAGTLTIPKQHAGRMPAVVMITGSGLEDRDETIPGVLGYRPFRQIADTLSSRGIAVLRMDDRGYGESGGRADSATTADFANDIRAALAYLKSRRDIDGGHLFLIGHSEGGEIAPMIAATDPSLAGIVTLAGPALTGRQISHAQLAYAVAHDTTLTATSRDSIMRAQDAILDSAAAGQPWVRYYLSYDPIPMAKRVRVPALVLQGGNDRQISPDQAASLAAALRAGGDKDVTVHVFPGLNHLFLADPVGDPSDYGLLPSKLIGADVLGTVADWVVQHSK